MLLRRLESLLSIGSFLLRLRQLSLVRRLHFPNTSRILLLDTFQSGELVRPVPDGLLNALRHSNLKFPAELFGLCPCLLQFLLLFRLLFRHLRLRHLQALAIRPHFRPRRTSLVQLAPRGGQIIL